jgi:hypothetical protein
MLSMVGSLLAELCPRPTRPIVRERGADASVVSSGDTYRTHRIASPPSATPSLHVALPRWLAERTIRSVNQRSSDPEKRETASSRCVGK